MNDIWGEDRPVLQLVHDSAAGGEPITQFSGRHEFLSNPFSCQVWFEGLLYPSTEHAFQAAKSLFPAERERIAAMTRWKDAKAAGRRLKLRPGWGQLRRAVMLQVVLAKFTQHPGLAWQLRGTGNRTLIEGNWWGDTDWGAVRPEHPHFKPELPWWHYGDLALAGHNWLGIALMTVREHLEVP